MSHLVSRRSRTRTTLGRSVGLAAALILLTPLLPGVPAVAAGGPTVDGPTTVASGTDYATEAFSDPLDYSNAEDVLLDDNGPTMGLANQRLENGRLVFGAESGGFFYVVYLPTPGAVASTVRDGPSNPVDASRYTHAAVRMYLDSGPGYPALQWFTCDDSFDCDGTKAFVAQEGWHTYHVDLKSGSGEPWQGWLKGLAFHMSAGPQVEIDWIRLYEPGDLTRIDSDGGTLYWDADADRSNNTSGNPGWGRLDGDTFPHSAYPPGTYRFYADGGPYSQPLAIDDVPRPVIDDPDEMGGEDYATARRGNAWDMSSSGDAVQVANATINSWSGGVLDATNTTNDPFVQLPLAGAIDTSRYHRLTVKMTYDGGFDLADAPGGGTHGRAIWWRQDTGDWTFHNSREILTFTDRDTYTIDLARPDIAEPGNRGWTGSPVTYLRWDPNEDPGARRWRLDDVQLRADDEATERFDVRWHDASSNVGAAVEFWADADRSGFDGHRIAHGITAEDGPNTFRWDVRDDLPGRWWLHVKADNGTSVGRQYARGPVYVQPRVAGANRHDTAIAMSRNAFPEGASAAVVAYSGNFPDALAAAPLASAAGGPVLLNPQDHLTGAVRSEIERLGATTVYLMGGEAVQTRRVADELASIAGVTVQRINGTDRFGTGAAAAKEAAELWRQQGVQDAGSHALIALGTGFPDALAAGPLAAAAKRPLLLVAPDRVPAVTNEALRQLGTDTVTVIGGPNAIPGSVVERIGGRITRHRIGGTNRYHTSALVSSAATQAGADPATVLVALGEDFPDALAAGPAVAAHGGILLLTPRGVTASETQAHLQDQRGKLNWLRIAGGPAAVHPGVVDETLGAAALPR